MNTNTIINQVFILLLIMATGFYAQKRKYINDRVYKGLSDIMLDVTLPLMIISSFNVKFSKEMFANVGKAFVVSVAAHVFFIAATGLLFFRYSRDKRGVLSFLGIFSSCGFIGFPIMESLYGKTSILYGSIYVLVFNVFLWTYGSYILKTKDSNADPKASFVRAWLNPGLISVAIGIILFYSPYKLPYAVFRAAEIVGSMTTPLSMIIIGSMLAGMNIKDVFSGWDIYYTSLIRLVVLPGIVLLILRLLGFQGILLGSLVIATAAPTAAVTVVLTGRSGGDTVLASRCVFISTILCMFTIPLLGTFL
ncbi:MAG: AEC family transporter [Clostridia bacterium]|nr:AEC family transporter [Clostridia bacterium]